MGRGRPSDRTGRPGRGRDSRGRERGRGRGAEAEVGQIRFGRRNATLFLLAAGVILIGFVALALGDATLAPILLVGGYLALIPWAIMARSGSAAGRVAVTGVDPSSIGREDSVSRAELGSDQGGG